LSIWAHTCISGTWRSCIPIHPYTPPPLSHSRGFLSVSLNTRYATQVATRVHLLKKKYWKPHFACKQAFCLLSRPQRNLSYC
jgi:hypothetical protein